ncbi:MAG TPA: NYN domain-containing protein [Polyangium sp.]|nr:NYN domain-containing protein [Polyangium sp.]
MDRVAIFVDAGYLFAQGSVLIAGEKLARSDLHIDHDKIVNFLDSLAWSITSLQLLRIYWYDGTSTGPTPQQLALAYRRNVKLRLGFVNQHGQQKGVDSLIVTDLITLARNRAMADALLLTGDEDIRVGVQQAQEYGVRVHLIGIEPARDNQSGFLVQEADSVHELNKDQISAFLSRAAARTSVAPSSSPPTLPPFEAVADDMIRPLSIDEIDAILQDSGGKSIPAEIDRRLLVESSKRIHCALNREQKQLVRTIFLEKCRLRRTR